MSSVRPADANSSATTVDDDSLSNGFIDTESYDVLTEELRQARREIDVLKLTTVTPFHLQSL
jgi:hypothetical protein